MTDDPALPFNPDTDEADWAWWSLAVADPSKIGMIPELMISEGHPEVGLYRLRRKGGPWERIQFFRDSAGWQCERNGRRISDRDVLNDLWLRSARQPVSEEAFDRATRGDGWADEPPKAPGLGHNLPGDEVDPVEALTIEFRGEAENAREILKEPIKDQDAADRCAIWAARLMEIGGKADALHTVEKEPVLTEYRRIDNKYRELREEAPGLARRLKKHNQDWLRELDRRESVRIAQAREQAEKLRREAEDAARLAVTPNQVADAGKKVSEAQAASRETEYRRPAQAGRTGQKTFLRTFTSAKVTDWPVLIATLSDHAEVRALCQSLADKAAKGGNPYPGTEIFQEKRV